MPLDLEDRIEDGLADLARSAPIPETWPELGAPVIRLDRPSPRRPRLVSAVVAAAAIVVVVAAVFAVQRTSQPGGTSHMHAASDPGSAPSPTDAAPDSDQNSVSALAAMGRWDPYGPRLTDAQLAKLVEIAQPANGAAFVAPAEAHVFARAEHIPVEDESHVEALRIVQTNIAAIGTADLLPAPEDINPETRQHLEYTLNSFRLGGTPQVPSRDGTVSSPFGRDIPIWLIEQHYLAPCYKTDSTCKPGMASAQLTVFTLLRVAPPAGTDVAHELTISSGVDGDVELNLGALGPVGTWTVR